MKRKGIKPSVSLVISLLAIALSLGVILYWFFHSHSQKGTSFASPYSFHNIHYLSPTARIDTYYFSFENKTGIRSIDIWVIKNEGRLFNHYELYKGYNKNLCANDKKEFPDAALPCTPIKLAGLPFIYRDSEDSDTSKNKYYFRKYFTRTPETILIISVLSKKKMDDTYLSRFIEEKMDSLPLFWKVNDPLSQYQQTVRTLMKWHQQQDHASNQGEALPTALLSSLQKASQRLMAAIDQQSKAWPKDPVIDRFLQQYKAQIQAMNTVLTHPSKGPTFSVTDEREITTLRAKQRLFFGLLNFRAKENDWDNTVDTLAVSLLPYAEAVLKQQPNSKALCLVLTQLSDVLVSPSLEKAILLAKQMAFLRQGDKYCSDYYGKVSTWGSLMGQEPTLGNKQVSDLPKTIQKYYGMSYAKYYQQFVQPLIPQALLSLKNSQENESICFYRAYFPFYRNPKRDALREAFILKGKERCSTQCLKSFVESSGVQCLQSCKLLGVFRYPIDCIEKCKNTPGVLFKDLKEIQTS